MSRPPMNHRNGSHEFDRDERELELLAAYALGALDPFEEREIERVLDGCAPAELESFEIAAAATLLSSIALKIEPMPSSVRAGVARLGREWSAKNFSPRLRTDRVAQGTPGRSAPIPATVADPSGLRFLTYAGWMAAAACLALAAVAWMPLGSSVGPSGTPIVGADGWLRAEPGMSQAELQRIRSELIVREGDTILASWAPTETPDPSAISAGGDVIWSTDEQCGVMRLAGLAPNDPTDHQYQLWIFDEDQKHPIDGGVFDVPDSGEVFVPVDPKLWVDRPVMFAITVEKPGGVVVSDRSRIALLGATLKPISECSPEELSGRRG